jgi:sugar lactone lactonase YvrE
MKSAISIFYAMVLFAALATTGCGGGGGIGSPPPPNPVPSISGISPGFVAAGAAAQSMTITGTNFISASTVSFNGTEHGATVVNSTQLTLTLSAADQASAACYTVAVNNPSPGGGASNSRNFAVRDPASPIYVVDIDNHRVQVFDTNGNYSSQFDHSFDLPTGVSIDCQGNIYVHDGNTNCWVDKFDSNANFLLQFGECLGAVSGPGVFDNASLVATDASGNVWVPSADFFYIEKYDSSANFQSMFCTAAPTVTGLNNCPMVTPMDVQPIDMAIDTDGNLWVSNINAGIAPPLVKFDSTGKYLTTFGSWGTGSSQFNANVPSRIELAFDAQGDIYVTDPGNNRVQKFDSQGNYESQFGSSGTGNGQFNGPTGIAIDASGNVYVTDAGNARVEKFDANGNYLSQFGSYGTGNGQFHGPFSVVLR